MTLDLIAEVAARHVKHTLKNGEWSGSLVCLTCDLPWPCDAARLVEALRPVLDELDSLRLWRFATDPDNPPVPVKEPSRG